MTSHTRALYHYLGPVYRLISGRIDVLPTRKPVKDGVTVKSYRSVYRRSHYSVSNNRPLESRVDPDDFLCPIDCRLFCALSMISVVSSTTPVTPSMSAAVA